MLPFPPPTMCSSGEKSWRRVMQKCSARHIPAGYHRIFVPGIDPTSVTLIKERDNRRAQNPNDPEIASLNLRISASLASSSRQRWMESLQEADRRKNSAHYWRFVKGLSGKTATSAPNQPIHFKGKVYTKKKSIANQFCNQYANVKEFQQTKESRKVYKSMKIDNPLDRSYSPFSEADTVEAIKACKNSTAAGPNGLTPLHLKHIGPLGVRYLTRLFNLSVQAADIPSIWKTANVIPVPKPNKPSDQGKSYRPISLLCPEVKVLERLNLPILRASLPPSPSQHGFRGNHSTVTALMPLTTQIIRGFNERKPALRTGLLCVDLSSAFDVIDHHLLLWKINSSDLNPNLKRWLIAYLRDRRVRVLYQGVASKCRKVKMGVPQGSVLSPLLFNFFVRDIASEAPVDQSYADDFHGAASDTDPAVIANSLSAAAKQLSSQAEEKGLSLSAPKSTVTLFTPWTRQFGKLPPVSVGGEVIPQVNHPKLLGVTYDPSLCFSSHAMAMVKKASGRVNILRALADSNFGHDKECLSATFKALIRPFFDYAASVVFPQYSKSIIHRLQLVQNRALRHVTGAHMASSIEHLHAESDILPVEPHLRLLSAQFLARALQPGHPSHETVLLPPGPRQMKPTLYQKVSALVEPHMRNGVVVPGSSLEVKAKIHTQVVQETISNYPPNRVLGSRPPRISASEQNLPRLTRVTLSQLRSGHCARLRDYQLRIGKSDTDNCPDCGRPASVKHVFECPSFPTRLSTRDLWTNPCEVANFLRSTSQFSHLPAPTTPPRQQPRRRPPPEPPPSPSGSLFSPLSLPPTPPRSPP